jgi:hypothetical protein
MAPQPAHADWINLTGAETAPNIAEIYVLDDRVRVKLEVYIGDLDKFDDLVPDEWLRDAAGRASLEPPAGQVSNSDSSDSPARDCSSLPTPANSSSPRS